MTTPPMKVATKSMHMHTIALKSIFYIRYIGAEIELCIIVYTYVFHR